MSLFIDEVVEENAKLKEENKHLIEKYEILGEEWSKLLDDKISYSHLLQKYKKAIKIIKEKKVLFISKGVCDIGNYYELNTLDRYKDITKEEYELLKEVLGNE